MPHHVLTAFVGDHLGCGTTVHVVILRLSCCPLVISLLVVMMVVMVVVLLLVLCDSFENDRLVALHLFRCVAEGIAGFNPAENV